MRVRAVILIILVSVLLGIVTYALIYYGLPDGSAGRGFGGGTTRYAWAPFVVVPVSLAVGVMAYLVLFPEIKQGKPVLPEEPLDQLTLEAVKRVLKADERAVVELLASQGGTLLQRDIARQSGFSRVKTHRILHRLSTRGVVVAEKHYNTYRISLADWLVPKASDGRPGSKRDGMPADT
jgi:hypothetical protein